MSDQMLLFDEVNLDNDDNFVPDEVIQHDGYTVSLYYPKPRHFYAWLREVDEHLLDMTGYSVHHFATVPTFGSWPEWPDDAYEAALAVLRQDAWGQAFLGDLDLE